MPTHNLPSEAIKLMADLSTSHMTVTDNDLCHDLRELTSLCPRIIRHAHGFIVFVSSVNDDLHQCRLQSMRELGFSDAFVDLYIRAASNEQIMLINFDADGSVIEGLPTFHW